MHFSPTTVKILAFPASLAGVAIVVRHPPWINPTTNTATKKRRNIPGIGPPFPLTLTLSLGEREQQSLTLENTVDVGFARRLATILPTHEPEAKSGSKLPALQTLARKGDLPEYREAFGVRPACRRFRQFMVSIRGRRTVDASHEAEGRGEGEQDTRLANAPGGSKLLCHPTRIPVEKHLVFVFIVIVIGFLEGRDDL